MKPRAMHKAAAEARIADESLAVPGFAGQVIAWQQQHGRHGLPWQGTSDPYRIWLSEIMLQQTQVAAVIPYYLRFLERFPTVRSLADAELAAVMGLWSGLGYYSRARNLHRCAQLVRDQHGGAFPASAATLATLPGIGRSTAAAIAAFAFAERAAILDGNVKRVFCRVFGIDGFPGEKAVENLLWARAQALLPERHIQAYTQGLMDLGATVCTRSRPKCDACPFRPSCVAHGSARVAQLPARKPSKPVPQRQTEMIIALCGDEVLLEQRGPSGIWGGLLSLPELPGVDLPGDASDAVASAAAGFGTVLRADPLDRLSHGFTHFTLHIRPWLVRVGERHVMAAEPSAFSWHRADSLAAAPLPAPVRKLLMRLLVEPRLAGMD
ncbi:A/G-specific adenine glycosylase [Lacisediminimonas sp.]|uniref:A/G-specific adenine glycosylase n=1 Tax=Lacisediminimonas sp. TaxID=3060582 RepID=UPI002722186B|nr:A/G-specific adenine glycosylase [Lacisediminimonas sp.]MDO8298661.1 A/G-specific adenine glycosylase [Lacisediminimonas sp.]